MSGDRFGRSDAGMVALRAEQERRNKPESVKNPALKVTSAAELEQREFKPVNFIQHPILPAGVALLASKPKMGKGSLSGSMRASAGVVRLP